MNSEFVRQMHVAARECCKDHRHKSDPFTYDRAINLMSQYILTPDEVKTGDFSI